MINKLKNPIVYYVIFAILLLIMMIAFFELLNVFSLNSEKDITMITNTLIRLTGGFIFLIVLKRAGQSSLYQIRPITKHLILVCLAFIIAINNFPIIAFIDQRAVLSDPLYRVVLFFVECLSVGFFEEILFRGIILILLLKQFIHLRYGVLLSIVLSSVFFGLIHIANLLSGQSLSATLLQIGYSFLMGMMWAIVYLKTGNLWIVMLLHAVYNFFGQVMFYLGTVEGRFDTITLILTIAFGVIFALYALLTLKKMNQFLHWIP